MLRDLSAACHCQKSTSVTGIIRDPRIRTRLFSRCHVGKDARLALQQTKHRFCGQNQRARPVLAERERRVTSARR